MEQVEDVGGRRKTGNAEGGTRLELFAGVRPLPFCAGNIIFCSLRVMYFR